MKFALNAPDGTRKVYRLKPFDELTLRDWGMLQGEPLSDNAHEALLEMVARATTAPKSKLKRLPIGEFETLLTAMADNVGKINAAKKADPGHSFTFQGDTYRIPSNLEAEPYEQWYDMVEVRWPKCERDVDAFAYSLAVFCTKEGEEYNQDNIEPRRELFMDLPASIALGTCAFFFGISKRYRTSISRCISTMLTSHLHTIGQTLRKGVSPTAPSMDPLRQ